MTTLKPGQFTLDHVYRLSTSAGIGSRHVVFIADEYAPLSRHADSVILTANPGAISSWVRDTDIERARAFASGAVTTQANLLADAGLLPDSSEGAGDDGAGASRKFVDALKSKLRRSSGPTDQPNKIRRAAVADKKQSAYSNAAVHGFWQVALHNKSVDLRNPLALAKFDDSSGLFLITEDGVPVSSGMYRANMVPGSPTSIADAFIVDVSPRAINGWKCPTEVCITSAERLRQSQRQNETKALRLVSLGALSLVAATAVYLVSASSANRRSLEFAQLSSEAQDSETRISEMRKTRFTPDKYPDGSSIVSINAIQQLYYSTQGLAFDWQNIITSDEREFRAIASRPFHQLTFPHTQNLRPDGTVSYSWPRSYVAPVTQP